MSKNQPVTSWLEYFHAASEAAGYTGRGWQASLARAAGVTDAHVSKWVREERIPDVESCRQLARVWNRPVLEVLVAAGHLDPTEVNMPVRPKPPKPAPQLSPEMQRLARLLDSNAPEDVKARIRAMITAAADLGELSSSTERPTGRSA